VAGVALASVPVVIHLLNRRRHQTVRWAAMAFLMRAMRQNRRRVRLEHWLLMAVRCGVVMLMGLALARPLGCGRAADAAFGGRTGLHVFVIDNSYSMAYRSARPGAGTHLDQAKRIVAQLIDRMAAGGEAAVVITAGRPAGGVLPQPTYDLQQARSAVGRIPQSFGATDLAGALRMAVAVGRGSRLGTNNALYLLTDATATSFEGPDAAALKAEGPELAALYHVVSYNLSGGPQWNQAVLDVRPSGNLITTNARFGTDFVAEVKGFGAPHPGVVQWQVDGHVLGGGGPLTPDDGTRPQVEPQALLQSAFKAGGPHVVTASILGDDPLQVDNARSRVVNVLSDPRVLVVEGRHAVGSQGGSGLNVRIALAGPGRSGRADGFAVPDAVSDLELSGRVLSDYRAVVLCGVERLTPAEADQLQAFVRDGGALLVFLGQSISPENYNAVWLPRHLIPGPLVRPVLAGEGKGFSFRFNPNGVVHPLLKAFAHHEATGLETAQAFGYWQADVPDDPALRVLDWKRPDGAPAAPGAKADPAVTEESVGRGHVVFVSTSADEEWVTFTRKPVYTELVNELLAGSVTGGDGWMNLQVGDPLRVPAMVRLTATPTLSDPGSTPIALAQTTAADGTITYVSPPLERPGTYALSTGAGTTPIAVNLPPEEADVRTIDNPAIRQALGGIDMTLNDDAVPAMQTAAAAGSDLSWSVMLLLFCLVGVDCHLARAFGHRRTGGEA
jgi:hypothetical protein